MIRFLAIRHLAIIDALDIEFGPGFNVLTGETGAGKSILVGAMGLLLGDRASPDLIRSGEDLATIQAIFDTPGDRELIVRREISSQGRSRAFLDGVLVTTAALRDATAGLVQLHGQHAHQALLDPDRHLDLLDRFAGLEAERARVSESFDGLAAAERHRHQLEQDAREREERRDYLAFQLSEMDRIAPVSGEDEALEATRHRLANAERLQQLSSRCYADLYDSDRAVLPALSAVWRRLDELATLDPVFASYSQAREGVDAPLQDLAFFLRSYRVEDASSGRLQQVEERLASLERLKRRYGPTLDDVLRRREEVRAALDALDSVASRLEDAQSAERTARETYVQHAATLSAARRAASRRLADDLQSALAQLAMDRARVELRFQDEAVAWRAQGFDRAELYLSANPGEDLKPLARIASGGELSRVMLAIESSSGSDVPGGTLIFDEVDAGIGGRTADAVGEKLRHLAGRCQVLCITHLPQIAAYAPWHYRITKSVDGDRTSTRLARVTGEARVAELARMMSGGAISASVLTGARDLLLRREGESEQKANGESERAKAKGRKGG